ncbi:gag-pol polyprotein [Cucumis melo var. makuwa]|uniref:Gag-pol polyprotein n=1 Tax=Cucumis melo var. makuwa TaxID=1194695 RepID=A0A5D3CEA7_CUCMM|nr:gag-pol polyprotein [Cucumis melo var. makuwa]
MEIIREGPSASHPHVLDGKNYSSWKSRTIFFIKTLDEKAWRVLVAGYEPPMVTMDGVSVPKLEVDWTDAEERASVGNARAINAIFNGTSKVKISRLQLITSKFEALKMTEDKSVSKYNERVLEITNGSLLLGEKISKSKIVRKVLRSLPWKFDMKVTAIEEAQDITTLKPDELFGSLFTFEMAMSNRHDGENSTRKGNDFSYRRNSDHGKKKKNIGRSFSCRECEGFGHYQAECPTYLRRQKKNYYVILSDKHSNDDEVDHSMNAFTACITEINSEVESECSDNDEDEKLTLEKLKMLRNEDSEARAIQKERI